MVPHSIPQYTDVLGAHEALDEEMAVGVFWGVVESPSHPVRMTQTGRRTLTLLEAIARGREPKGLMELAALAHLDKSTAARLLADLLEEQFVTREERTKQYSVGPALLALAGAVLRGSSVVSVSRPQLENLRDLSGESASLHIRRGGERLCIAGLESPQLIRRIVVVGEPAPLYSGPTGKVLLAFSPRSTTVPVIEAAVRSGIDRDWLLTKLDSIRSHGYMCAIGDRTPDAGAIAMPVFDSTGLVAALTVSGPGDRFTMQTMRAFVPTLRAAAAHISETLGATRSDLLVFSSDGSGRAAPNTRSQVEAQVGLKVARQKLHSFATRAAR